MYKLLPKELMQASELMDQAKLDEAFEIIEKFEKNEMISPKDQLSALLIKARIYAYTRQYEEHLKISERAYQMSQDLGLVSESIEALLGKAIIAFIGDRDKATTYVIDAERRLNSLADDPSTGMLRRNLLHIKSWILWFKGNLNGAAKLAQECLKLTKEEKFGNKLDLATVYLLLGFINAYQGHGTKALEYAMESLERNKELNHAAALAVDYSLIAKIYLFEGDYDQALQYCKQSLSIKETHKRVRLDVLWTLAQIYYMKSNLNRALKYQLQAVALAEELNITDELILNLGRLGFFYRLIGEKDLAVENFERCLMLSDKWGFIQQMAQSLFFLTVIYIDEDSREIANRYFSRLSDLYDQNKDKGYFGIPSFWYLASKAYMMKTSTRIRDRAEAQTLFKELINLTGGLRGMQADALIFSLGNLCDLLLEELSMYNDPKIIDEIVPLITKGLGMAKLARNYHWLAEIKLLQAKLALMQMNTEEARRLMVQAQRIADLHGLDLLAYGISSEHDKLLEQTEVWDTFKKEEAPISERIKLASTNGVLERLQGKYAIEPPELVDEEPILLLIMDSSGATYFNHPFMANWDYSDLFSSFMSAFNTFSSEIFSRSIDRIRIGENTILINPAEPFLACYVIKGQSYPALQKLTRFTEAIRENSEIWQALNKSVKTSEMLELDKPPSLKTVITEIFS